MRFRVMINSIENWFEDLDDALKFFSSELDKDPKNSIILRRFGSRLGEDAGVRLMFSTISEGFDAL